ncbi:MAG TPA: EAL domain-containing protein [Gammaproteobacteria bacterium]|jgi:predicted signal transduction protein with EAL and GGDEF domain
MALASTSGAYRRYVEPNRRVLVVDDNEAIHEDFRKTLGEDRSGNKELAALDAELFGKGAPNTTDVFELTSAHQGDEAIELVRKARAEGLPYALAFVDVRMPPGLDGIATTRRMLEADPEINVVICSAYSDHSWEEMTETIGRTDRVLILKKPFDTIEVRQLTHALRKRWELARVVALKVEDLSKTIDARTRELESANAKLTAEGRAREAVLARLEASNEQIRALAYQDGLTGLPNRRLLNEHLEKVLARSRRKGIEFALLFVDIDNFKLINDTVGHHAADEGLRAFATALGDLIRADDLLGVYAETSVDLDATISVAPVTDSVLSRLGGDEFVILLPDIKDRFSAGSVAHRILKRLEQPFIVGAQEVFFTASIGIATYPADGERSDVLLRNADRAMYHAKQQGKAAFQYFSAAMNAASVERMTLENGLRKALDEGRLALHYQPVIDCVSGAIVGAEALLRWNDPVRGYISPATFIPIAEDSGLILPIGEWVMRRACRQAAEWQRSGLRPIPVSVNVSGVQFRRQDVCALAKRALEESGLDPTRLRIEITETALMSVHERAAQILEQLRGMGIGIALDDFGTGYSSLSYLKAFPLDTLKIDKSFVAEMMTDDKSASIIKAIVAMTRVLALRVVGEGVEDREQFEFLKSLGCDAVQGFYFSSAVPSERFAELLASARMPAKITAPKARKADR